MSTACIETLAEEIVASIVSYLDRPSLLALMQTKRFLRPHAEYELYRRVDFRASDMDMDKNRSVAFQSLDWRSGKKRKPSVRFISQIGKNPRLGTLVRSFYIQSIQCQELVTVTKDGRTTGLLSNAVNFMPNLKNIAMYHPDEIPACLFQAQWPTVSWECKIPPFKLERLGLDIRRPKVTLDFPDRLRRVLLCQPTLRQFSLMFSKDAVLEDDPFSKAVGPAREYLCPDLEVLEGTDSVVQYLLPNRPRIKYLFWECMRPYKGESLDHQQVGGTLGDVDVDFRDSFFTAELCEAYGRLENLVFSEQIWFLPLLSPYLKSLKTLFLCVGALPELESEMAPLDDKLFLRTIGEMQNLEMLVVSWEQDADAEEIPLDPAVVFKAASKNLKYFAISDRVTGNEYGPAFLERREDGRICPVGREKFEEVWYLYKGWSVFGTEEGTGMGFGPRIFPPQWYFS